MTTLVNLIDRLAEILNELAMNRDDVDELVRELLEILISESIIVFALRMKTTYSHYR